MSNIGNKNTMAKNLQYYMKLKNVSRKDVCKDLGFSYSTFCDWANGTKYPRMDKVEMLANYFNILKSDLIEDKSKINNEVGNKLKQLRESRNISTEEIAMEFNISVEDVLNYENGLKEIPIEYLKMFATYFNVTVDELIYFDVDNHRTIFITKDEELSRRYKKWQELIGYDINFTDEEIDEIINFAKYVISKRKDK